jgi:L-seryl-tRNA(Ser) seleniumtransferase
VQFLALQEGKRPWWGGRTSNLVWAVCGPWWVRLPLSSANGFPETALNFPASIPSVDRLLGAPAVLEQIERHGRALVLELVRLLLAEARSGAHGRTFMQGQFNETAFGVQLSARIGMLLAASQRPVLNLTGTVLHTNLGRAVLPEVAVQALIAAASSPTNLEYDLGTGERGERDQHVEDWLSRLTGAEAGTLVNNNAAAVFIILNTLAIRKEVIVSRGELIEIGGAFRLPDIMMRAGCRLVEVGTTNRTHLRDYEEAIGPRTAALMKVHTSNYEVRGFTSSVDEEELARLAHGKGVVLVSDLGSGTLIELERHGLPHERTAREMLLKGVDLVSFSGDKLLGGPQAGLIVGNKGLIARINKNPLKRVLRVDKLRLAALEAVLKLYGDPQRLTEALPTLRWLARSREEIELVAQAVVAALIVAVGKFVDVKLVACKSQIGSGALPLDLLPSVAVALKPKGLAKRAGRSVQQLAAAFRALPVPVIGRIQDDRLLFDLRTLDQPSILVSQLDRLDIAGVGR